jgi:hypothetical protein
MRWLITVRHDETRTQDFAINASSAYQAGWLYKQLHPGARIIAIRPAPGHAQNRSDN